MIVEQTEKLAKETFGNYPEQVVEYAEYLFNRRELAEVVPEASFKNIGWQPKFNDCHNNVDYLCNLNKSLKPARGWLVCDYSNETDFVIFKQHSVLISDEALIEITPTYAKKRSPFLHVPQSDDQFFTLDQFLVNGDLFYVFKK